MFVVADLLGAFCICVVQISFASVDFALGFLGDSAEVWKGAEDNLQEQV